MHKGYIYRHWLINDKSIEKSYVGQVYNRTPQQRWGKNGNGYTRKQDHKMARAIRKYGWDSFSHGILLTIECETEEELLFWLNEWEKYYIEKYNSFYNGYNSTTGGGRGKKDSEETKLKKSIARMGDKNPMYGVSPKERMDEETYKQWLHKQKTVHKCGEENPNYGNTWDDEQRERQSRIQKEIAQRDDYVNPFKGKHHSEETKKKYFYGEANPMYGRTGENNPFYGKHHTEETKHKISKSKKGKPGNPHSEDSKQKISEAQKGSKNHMARKVICLETKQVFDTVKQAQDSFVIKSGITQCCKGRQKTAGGYHWMYYDEYLKIQEEQQNKTQDLVTEVA